MLGVFNMRIHIVRGFLVCVLALCAPRAWAFLDPPYITPANPTSADMISVNIYGGECDLVDGGVVWPPPITQQGNELTILFTGSHEEDPEFCNISIGTRTYPVGVYTPGNYILHVEWRYTSLSGWVHETLGIIPFTVTGVSPPQPVETPALSAESLTGLFLALTVMALFALRKYDIQAH